MQEKTLSEKIKIYINTNRLTQPQFAKLTGVSQPTISNILKGNPSKRMGRARRKLEIFLRKEELTDKKKENHSDDMIVEASSKLIEAIINFQAAIKKQTNKTDINE